MMAWYKKKPVIIPQKGYAVGKNIRSDVAVSAQAAQNYIRNWYGAGQFFTAGGFISDTSVNPYYTGTQDQWDTDIFYVVSRLPDLLSGNSSQRQLMGVLKPWNFTDSCRPGIRWFPFYNTSTGSFGAGTTLFESAPFYTANTDYTGSRLPNLELYNDFKVSTNSGAVTVSALALEGIQPAALSIATAPGLYLADEQARVLAKRLAKGNYVGGYDSATIPSLGELIQLAGDKSCDDNYDSCERMQRRTYFQWGHHRGIRIYGKTDPTNIFGEHTPHLKPRRLYGEDSHRAVMYVVYSGSTSTLSVNNITNGYTANQVCFSSSHPTISNPITFDIDCTQTNELRIEAEQSIGTSETIVHTVAIFEE
jgi:hypothetical protein